MANCYQHKVLAEQQILVNQIMSPSQGESKRMQQGLNIYRNNLLATASQALAISFPTVAKQIGEKLMVKLAALLLKSQPPYQGDWAEWGVGFPNFLKTIAELEQYPFVAESARLDLAIHQAERAENKAFKHQSVYLLQHQDLEKISLLLNDSVHFFHSNYPVIELRNNEIHQDSGHRIKLQNRISSGLLNQNVLVFRTKHKAQAIEVSSAEFSWLTQIAKEMSIAQALSHINDQEFNFSSWLPLAINQNIVTKLVLID